MGWPAHFAKQVVARGSPCAVLLSPGPVLREAEGAHLEGEGKKGLIISTLQAAVTEHTCCVSHHLSFYATLLFIVFIMVFSIWR